MKPNDRIFFVVGTGRSGTLWLSRFLNFSDIAYVHHERLESDRPAREITSKEESEEYIRIRVPLIQLELQQKDYYGEVNGYMTFHVDALRSVLGAKVFLVVRDGRDVIRSWYSRATFTGKRYEQFLNPEGDTRFEKLCWLWNWENRRTLSQGVEPIILERLLKDWAYFNSFFGFLKIDKRVWDNERNIKQNASPAYALPEYEDWTSEQKAIFNKRCGCLMKQLGYM